MVKEDGCCQSMPGLACLASAFQVIWYHFMCVPSTLKAGTLYCT